MHRFPSREPHKRGFTLMELIVVVVVLGLLATLAFMAFRANIDRTTEAKQRQRTTSLLREARTLYVQKIYQDPDYTWQQAIIDASADLPTYKTNALDDSSDFPEGVSATGGTNLNTGSNAWTLESDTGSGVYSTVSSELVFKVQSSTLYVASYTDSTRCVFGMVSQDTPPSVWSAGAVGSSCDAESATSGPPASGAYAPGTTAAGAASTTTTAASSTTSTTLVVLSAPSVPPMSSGSMSGSDVAVSFAAPASSGGSPVTGYTATCTSSNGGTTRSASGASSPITVASIDPLKTYTCSVTATNAVGTSAPSGTITVSSTASYSCPSGGSLSGSTCTQTVTSYSYICPPGGTQGSGVNANKCYAPYGSEIPNVGCWTVYGWYDNGSGCEFMAYVNVSYSYPTYAASATYSYTVT